MLKRICGDLPDYRNEINITRKQFHTFEKKLLKKLRCHYRSKAEIQKFLSFVVQLLHLNPAERKTAVTLLEDKYLEDVITNIELM